jgi:hypothetical protein
MFVLNKSLQTAFTADVHLTGQFLSEYPTHNKKVSRDTTKYGQRDKQFPKRKK